MLDALAAADGGFGVELESFDWGSDRQRRVGTMMPSILEGAALTPDLGGTARTDEVTAAVIGVIKRQNDAETGSTRSVA